MRDTSIFKRRETTFIGGETLNGTYVPKQTVTIGRCVDEDEDIWTVTDVNGKTHRVESCELNPHPEAPLANDEFMALVMQWSRTGPLMHAFILLAIEEYAKSVLAAPVEELDTPFMSGALWQETAREYLGWVAARKFIAEEKRKEHAPAG